MIKAMLEIQCVFDPKAVSAVMSNYEQFIKGTSSSD